MIFSLVLSSPPLTCSDSLPSLSLSLQTPSPLTNPGRTTARAERRSSPRWPVAWFLSSLCTWRRKARRQRRREDRMPPPPLPAPTLTSSHAAFLTSEPTVPSGSSSRTWTPPHPPKHRGTMSGEHPSVIRPEDVSFGASRSRIEKLIHTCVSSVPPGHVEHRLAPKRR